MDLTKIIAISGKPGLYSLVKQSRNGFIVESIETNKKASIPSSNNVSLLMNVAMYTTETEVPLEEVFNNIAKKENCGPAISHKESGAKLHEYFASVLPNYDQSRVYDSDLKKLFQWYNLLQKAGLVTIAEAPTVETPAETEAVKEEKPKAKKATKKTETSDAEPTANKEAKEKKTPKAKITKTK